ncbi:MAG TPA: decaprenyl-phosphate phosphoribosyltransferase [Polyangiaceae bacterium]
MSSSMRYGPPSLPIGRRFVYYMASDPAKNLLTSSDDTSESTVGFPPSSEGSFWWRVGGVVWMLRPHQWIKNVFVLAPVVFAKEIFDPSLLVKAASAFAIFCAIAGAVYALNDLGDVDADQLHPVKRYRPIASGRVPKAWVWPIICILVAGGLLVGAFINPWFAGVLLAYFVQNIAYTKKLKHVAYVDVGCISLGFVLRVLAGGFATGISISSYLVLCTALLALFLGFGKRRHELAAAERTGKQRIALESYRRSGLDVALALTAVATVCTYLAYTLNRHTREFFHTDWLWTSTIFVVLSLARFLVIVRSRPKAESPTQEMLRDGPFVAIIMGWVVMVVWVVYQLAPAH